MTKPCRALVLVLFIAGWTACSTPRTSVSAGTGGGDATGTGGRSLPGTGGLPGLGSGGSAFGGASTNTGGTTPTVDGGSDTTGSAGSGAGGVGGSLAPADGSAGTGAQTGNPDAGVDGGRDPHPLLAVLAQFTAADVPVTGPMESPPSAKNWTSPATLPVRTGMGIAQHPMLYVGENYNRITLVNEGRVIWTYDTAPGFELDDIWMLSNGHILYSHMTFIEEITPQKQVVWHMAAPAGTEIHGCQPIGLDKVLLVRNGQPPMAILMNKTTGVVESQHALDTSADVHPQFRRIRMTAAGTYIAPYLTLGKVVEYDKAFNVIWSYISPRPWSAVRLHNGNTLIQDETQSAAKEVNAAGQVVWQLTRADFTLPAGAGMGNTQTCERLASGNTVMFGNGGTNINNIQAVEVTPAKQVIWMLQDWIHLGDATAAQFLDEPGIPEVPGDTEH